MTAEEKAFNDALDAHPEDHTTRLVYADWLEERDDPRAAGYRALGKLGRVPRMSSACWWYGGDDLVDRNTLPRDWFNRLRVRGKRHSFAPDFLIRDEVDDPASRQELEDAAALAFPRLPPERQAELLTPAVPAASG